MSFSDYFSGNFSIHDGYLVGLEKLKDSIVVSIKDLDNNDYFIGIHRDLDPVIVAAGIIFPVGLSSLSCYPSHGDIFPSCFIESQLSYQLEDRLILYDRLKYRFIMSIEAWDGDLFFLIRRDAVASLGTITFKTSFCDPETANGD